MQFFNLVQSFVTFLFAMQSMVLRITNKKSGTRCLLAFALSFSAQEQEPTQSFCTSEEMVTKTAEQEPADHRNWLASFAWASACDKSAYSRECEVHWGSNSTGSARISMRVHKPSFCCGSISRPK